MKNHRLLICILAASLCLSACSGKVSKTDSSTTVLSSTSTESTTKETTTEVPIGGGDKPAVIDGKQTISSTGHPLSDASIKQKLEDPDFVQMCDEVFGKDYHFADHGFYMIDLQHQSISYEYLHVPIIKNEMIVGMATLGLSATFGYDPSLLDPNYPSDPSGYSYIGTINEILKENPDEHFIWLYNDSAEFLLDSHNELHELKEYGLEDLTIQNQDTLYENYYVEECTIGADIFA
ncbi:MAG: hypothetical protein J5750_05205 [Clostridiales bacterium]|nr:hypothetical protein [Clostridiales bacterium]